MWAGSSTTRKQQILTGTCVGIVSLPFLLLGFGVLIKIFAEPTAGTIFLTGSICLLVGILGEVLAYRLVSARGVKKGGGVLSPIMFNVLGITFALVGGYLTFHTLFIARDEISFKIIIDVTAFVFLSSICFVAARHRGAMREIN